MLLMRSHYCFENSSETECGLQKISENETLSEVSMDACDVSYNAEVRGQNCTTEELCSRHSQICTTQESWSMHTKARITCRIALPRNGPIYDHLQAHKFISESVNGFKVSASCVIASVRELRT